MAIPHEPITTRMSSKGQIVIPRQACDALGVHAGTEFTLSIDGDSYRLTPKKKAMEIFFALHRERSGKVGHDDKISVADEIGDYLLQKDERIRKQARKYITPPKKKG